MNLIHGGSYSFIYEEIGEPRVLSGASGGMLSTRNVFSSQPLSYDAIVTEVAEGIFKDESGRRYIRYISPVTTPDSTLYLVIEENGKILQIREARKL